MSFAKFAPVVARHGLCIAAAALAASTAQATVIYSNLPAATPGNVPSLGYQATSTYEFGDHVQFAAGPRQLNSVTVLMSSWALAADYPSIDPAGFSHDLTFNLYNTGGGSTPGSLIASLTENFIIPFRPPADPTCPGGTAWRSTADGNCYNGYAFTVTFDFSAMGISLPDELIFGLAFNTQSRGYSPTGVAGPYNSLNFGLVGGAPSVGTNPDLDDAYIYSTWAGGVTTAATGQFNRDTNWLAYAPGVSFDAVEATAVPEPGTLAISGLALAALGWSRRRKPGAAAC